MDNNNEIIGGDEDNPKESGLQRNRSKKKKPHLSALTPNYNEFTQSEEHKRNLSALVIESIVNDIDEYIADFKSECNKLNKNLKFKFDGKELIITDNDRLVGIGIFTPVTEQENQAPNAQRPANLSFQTSDTDILKAAARVLFTQMDQSEVLTVPHCAKLEDAAALIAVAIQTGNHEKLVFAPGSSSDIDLKSLFTENIALLMNALTQDNVIVNNRDTQNPTIQDRTFQNRLVYMQNNLYKVFPKPTSTNLGMNSGR